MIQDKLPYGNAYFDPKTKKIKNTPFPDYGFVFHENRYSQTLQHYYNIDPPKDFLTDEYLNYCKTADAVGLRWKNLLDIPQHIARKEFEARALYIKEEMRKGKRHDPKYYADLLQLVQEISKGQIYYQGKPRHIKHKINGTLTGRLMAERGTFPIMNLKREERKKLKASNDFLMECDYNAADGRALYTLLGYEQPEGDFYESFIEERNIKNRDEGKRAFFRILYNKHSIDDLEHIKKEVGLDLTGILQYVTEEEVFNFFGKRMQRVHGNEISHIVQSTSAEIVLRKAIKLSQFLKGKKTRIAFILYDAIYLDFSKEDEKHMEDIEAILSSSDNGKYLCSFNRN